MILRCQAPRKQPREPFRVDAEPCRGFVGRFGYPVRVVSLLAHSDLRSSDHNHVVPCQRCGVLHEIARLEPLRTAA